MSTRKLWGELEDENCDDTILQNVNFNPIIELGMQNIPEIPITVKSSPIELPKPNLITHTIQLQEHYRQLSTILENSSVKSVPPSLPPIPVEPIIKLEHEGIPPVSFILKEYCDFALGKGPVILPFTPESHKRALRQCAAIAVGQIGISTCTNTALNAVADALDFYMSNMCKLMRTVADREASGIKSGYPDVMSKVFAELQVGNLHEFHENRIVRYHERIKMRCENLRAQCVALAVGDITPQLKLEEVPELHFPAALDAYTPSLEPGFQMLHNLEQEQLQGLELLDTVATLSADDIKVEPMEYSQPESAKMSLSPSAKKKRK